MIPKGAKVQVRDSDLGSFYVAFQNRIKGRVGVVAGHVHGRGTPIVTFPAAGRKKEFKAGQIHERFLDVVEMPSDGEIT